MGARGAGSHRERLQTGCGAQTLISTGICLLKSPTTCNIEFTGGHHSGQYVLDVRDLNVLFILNLLFMVSVVQLKPLPRTVTVRTVYEARDWSYQLQHGAVWGNQEFSVSGLYSAPPALELGNQTLKGKAPQGNSAKPQPRLFTFPT